MLLCSTSHWDTTRSAPRLPPSPRKFSWCLWSPLGRRKVLVGSWKSVYGDITDIWLWINTYRYITIVGWTSIYQLFWGSLGTRVLTHSHMVCLKMVCIPPKWLLKYGPQVLKKRLISGWIVVIHCPENSWNLRSFFHNTWGSQIYAISSRALIHVKFLSFWELLGQ